MSDVGSPLEEYKDASANMRHYSSLRFGQLTVFMAVVGVLLLCIVRLDDSAGDLAGSMLKLFGLVVTVSFWIMEERVVLYWDHHRRRAETLEETLQFAQYTGRRAPLFVRGRAATRLLFGVALVLWATAMWRPVL